MNWREDTLIVHEAQVPDKDSGAVVPGIIPAVAYAFPDLETAAAIVAGDREGTYYGRYGNPTTLLLEKKVAKLEGAEEALGLSSGMAAISSALLAFLKKDDHVLVTKDVYAGTYKFVTTFASRFGISTNFVDCTDVDKVEAAIQPNTKVLYIETPSNPCLTILDIGKLSQLAHSYGLKVIIDNTFMTPYLQKPIEMGADLVVHSATKYLNGHGDVLAGFVVGKTRDISFIRKNIMGDLGQNLNAWDSFLILRGMKTLAIRMHRHCMSAQTIAEYLKDHFLIEKVYYPGLTSHPQYELAKKQMKMMGGIVSFEVKGGLEAATRFMNSLRLAMISFSLGDPETLVQHPASMSHFAIPGDQRGKFNITDGLVRLSIGLEDVSDIIEDLDQALGRIKLSF
ncbi:PLP-dependent aspartate aminotransferase family protein [Paenibacillus sp. LjRoot153]|uniref:trans-sulfuration enzyme family protein n=1 Tax=Paenibacillus sp. LjRoot153 TaxID=3342270 RepID=UPI003ECD00D3